MTKKDYKRIASAIAAVRNDLSPGTYQEDGPRLSKTEWMWVVLQVEGRFAEMLAAENPNFDKDKFYAACRE